MSVAANYIDFTKYSDGLVPAVVQDDITGKVLMLGFMNEEAFTKTQELSKVTFYSRSKGRLWTKGEESGNFLILKDIKLDCDKDTLLIKASPIGPVCHTGADTCWDEKNVSNDFLYQLEQIIADRKKNPSENRTPLLCLKKALIRSRKK
jgi:phosphoribosyl-ATP pyrophosphohydrolase/phosphoribosyl-AMP cyclohydrolase